MTDLPVRSPLSGRLLKTYRRPTAEEVAAVMARAREAAGAWRTTALEARVGFLRRLRAAILERADEIAGRLQEATGEAKTEAFLSEIFPVLGFLKYYEGQAARILAPRRAARSIAFPYAEAWTEYRPMGVVAVIAPWNYPFQLALVPALSALTAGNAVVVKPSPLTLPIGDLVGELCRQAGWPEGVMQVLPGDGETGRRLIEAGPDKVFFTGSREVGRQVAEAAARRLIPVDLELGGKDPMIVFADAPFERAVRGAVYGAFCNGGQVCVSVERVYVEAPLYDRFVDAVTQAARALRVGTGPDDDLGCPAHAGVVARLEEQLEDARRRGARTARLDRQEGDPWGPVVLSGVDHTMRIMREETFGPALPLMPFRDEAEAVRLANDSPYGLNASVWTRDLAKGRRVASALRVGNCAVNDVIKNIGHPALAFGGVKQSGWGRYHGPEGLRAFSEPVSVVVHTGRTATEANWFPYSRELYDQLLRFADFLYGTRPWRQRARGGWRMWRYFRRFLK